MRSREEVAGALAAYLWPWSSAVPEGVFGESVSNEFYGFPILVVPDVRLPDAAQGYSRAVHESVFDEVYYDALAEAVAPVWPDWLDGPNLVRTSSHYTVVGSAYPPSFRDVEIPPQLSELAIPVREARRRISDARRVMEAVRDAGPVARRRLEDPRVWIEEGESQRRGGSPGRPRRRQDWRPRGLP